MSKGLRYGVMASIVTIGMLGTTAVWAANSGGHVIDFLGIKMYVGKKTTGNNVQIDSSLDPDVVFIYGGYSANNANSNILAISSGNLNSIDEIVGGYASGNTAKNNTVNITGGEFGADAFLLNVIGGRAEKGNVTGNKVNISGGTIEGQIYGGYTEEGGTISNNIVTISGKAILDDAGLFGGYSFNDTAIIKDNKLIIDNWSGSALQVENFNSIDFKNLQWKNGGTALAITVANRESLANTKINLLSLAGGTKPAVNQSMYIIKGESFGFPVDLGINKDNVTVSTDFSAGVAAVGTGKISIDEEDGSWLKYTITGLMQNPQTHLVAQNHAVAAAFVNQGTDLISDSLDTLSRDDNYGVKTFAAVHGNHSKYDVNSDLKINGWSGIVGVGNEKTVGNGDFSWGVFFENGSGNYNTYNGFNGNYFRGDGNVVYNGGGIAARFEQDNGVYTEGSLRAGLLKNEMKDALRDGAGNSYGYKSESTYYGAHIGVGKIISLDTDKDLDIYGKFFHTYTDGDTFTVAGDKFDLDSITSDRLRIGARLMTNKENKLSTYYGLAYEYEFNGDADMRVENTSTPQQSLKGSSYMAEIGINYQPSSDSPWSFDLSMRGYTGQREGFSGSVQAVYSF